MQYDDVNIKHTGLAGPVSDGEISNVYAEIPGSAVGAVVVPPLSVVRENQSGPAESHSLLREF